MPRLSLSAWGFQQVYLDAVKEGASRSQAWLEWYGIWVDYQAPVLPPALSAEGQAWVNERLHSR